MEYRLSRKNRQDFWVNIIIWLILNQNILKNMHQDGQITIETKFKEIFPLIKDNDIVKEMYSQKGKCVYYIYFEFL